MGLATDEEAAQRNQVHSRRQFLTYTSFILMANT